ncbi:MAG: transcriptional regulator, partial [Lachnospiraceae bacterium]|nr:transcriptional regulator [Lachnospiraceae bacterium]
CINGNWRSNPQVVANSLFSYYQRKENYKEAGKYLEYFPEDSASRKRMQAVIYNKTGNTEGAYKVYQEILFSKCNILNMVFNSLCALLIKENNIELAEKWADKLSGLAVLFDMGNYNSKLCKLDLAVYKKDTSATLSISKAMLSSLMQITGYTKSFMYSHMEFKELDKAFY